MSGFERLHPALQHQIANGLGWRSLRPFQDEAIPPILAGKHLVVLAPTAGGKTEAAFFPILSRMLTEDWRGLSVLYVCPIKALLNNLAPRLERYCGLVGRRMALRHGDVPAGARARMLRDPPDCLLTTPESLEVLLVSSKVDAAALFANLQAVIVDEVHAFAGDDRGRHLLAVLERLSYAARRELQRIGLSATVGNPERLVDWLAGSCRGPREAYVPPPVSTDADVRLDFVGSLGNAALVISRLHRGEKRLAFVDSRSRAEQLAAELRRLDVTTFVTHSSLSAAERRDAEEAFATRDDCVIVATSVLELGIDVGDLDRVLQIDAPPTVASFLQRMGRTGRRPGSRRNCLFLATKDETLIRAAGLIDLWEAGFVEPIEPPERSYHVLAQQLMALILQEGGIGRRTWTERIGGLPAFGTIPAADVERIVAHMLACDILWDEEGLLGIGRAGEERFGRRHFMELLSVFLSAPLYAVLHGRQELGFVDETTFFGTQAGPRVLLLGGRAWRVTHLDRARRVAYVETTQETGRSRWKGAAQGLSGFLAAAIARVLASDADSARWSKRATERIGEIRPDFAWLDPATTALVSDSDDRLRWWTFAGSRADAVLATALASLGFENLAHDAFCLEFAATSPAELTAAIESLRGTDLSAFAPAVDEAALDNLKFSACLPSDLALDLLRRRLADPVAAAEALRRPLRRAIVESSND